MPSQRSLSWSAALRDIAADRSPRAEVREERLRTTAGLRGSPALALTAWRGRSGKRYVAAIHALDADVLAEAGPVVALAVARDADGFATLIAVTDQSAADWIAQARAAGATELHVHRLAESQAERAAIVRDLRPLPH